MDISGFQKDALRLNSAKVSNPKISTGKSQTQLTPEKKTTEGKVPTSENHHNIKAPQIQKSSQNINNILNQLRLPNTPQNNNIAQALLNYKQPVNNQTMTLLNQTLGPLINKGPLAAEAGLTLLLNNLPVNNNSVTAVISLLSSSGIIQNLASFNKDLQNLVKNLNNKEVNNGSNKLNNNIIENLPKESSEKNNSIALQQIVGQSSQEESIENKKNIKNQTKMNDEDNKVSLIKGLIKNPLSEEDNSTVNNKNQNIKKFSNIAKSISNKINNLINLNIIKHPENFPVQISILKKYFSELDVEIKDIEKILLKMFPEINTKKNDSLKKPETNILNSFLKIISEDKKVKIPPPKSEFEMIKNILEQVKDLSLNITAREILAKSSDSFCLPISVIVDSEIYQTEILINQEESHKKNKEAGKVPINIILSVETKNLGTLSIDISNLKKDLRININVENNDVKKIINENINKLQEKVEKLPFELMPIACNINLNKNENKSILLPTKYKAYSLNRIEGIV